MKTKLLTLLMIIGYGLTAQTLTNPNFENWTTQDCGVPSPTGWWSYYCTANQTTDAFQGTYASKIQGFMSCGTLPGMMINGKEPASYNLMDAGTPFTTKPNTFSGYYKFTNVSSGDSAEVTVILKKYNTILMRQDTVAYGITTLAASQNYTLFTVNIKDMAPGIMPDSIITIFNSSKYFMVDTTTGTLPILYVDRIIVPETVESTGIEENNTTLLESSIYPNPFTEKTTITIKGDISKFENLSITIFDELGKQVKTIKNITTTIDINRDDLSTGNYFYQVSNNKTVISKGKIIID